MADPDKTEEPTGKRLSEARRKGNVARSSDATTAAILTTALLMARAQWPSMGRALEQLMARTIEGLSARDITPVQLGHVLLLDGWVLVTVTGPFCLALLVVGVLINLVQIGPMMTFETMRPDLTKLNPFPGFKRFVSAHAFVELGKNLLKIALMTAILWGLLAQRYPMLVSEWRMDPSAMAPLLADTAWQMSSRLIMALIAIGIADYAWQRFDHRRSLRMSKQEVKDEAKQQEGNPFVKGEIRKRMRQAARRRMMQQVPKATVVVTNPTHYAIALLYDRDAMPTPMVVAKGADLVALRIRAVAEEHGVPIVENPPVARELYKIVEIGDIIPPALYQAIAEILVAIQTADPKKIAL